MSSLPPALFPLHRVWVLSCCCCKAGSWVGNPYFQTTGILGFVGMMLLFFESTRAICKPVLVLKATCAFEMFLPERGQTDFSSGASLLEEERGGFPAPLCAGPFINCACPGINVPCCRASSFQLLPIMVTALLVLFSWRGPWDRWCVLPCSGWWRSSKEGAVHRSRRQHLAHEP